MSSYVADYEIMRHLAPGNHGDWWLATPPERLGRGSVPVELKALWRDATDLDFDRMVRELRLMSDLRDPHLAHLIEAGETDGRLFLVREHYPLGTLDTAAPKDPSTLIAVAHAARGAHALHARNVAHRDIRPATVLRTDGGGVLSELGLAQQMTSGATTGIGPVGALDYVAPEIVLGERGSAATDVWALGVTLHRAWTGTSVYGDAAVHDVLAGFRRVLDRGWQLAPGIDPSIGEVVRRCLAADPDDRFGSALDLAVAIEPLAAERQETERSGRAQPRMGEK